MSADGTLRLAFQPLPSTLVVEAMGAVKVYHLLFRFKIAETDLTTLRILAQVRAGLKL